MHAWNWLDICKTKHEGGLGIRRVADINEATGIRIVLEAKYISNNLWANWMLNRYLQNQLWDTLLLPLHLTLVLGSSQWKQRVKH